MRPGEVLFVPGGTPHAVENLTDSLAVAGNFVDESNLAAALTEMRWLALRDAEMGRVVASLEEMEVDEEEGMEEECCAAAELVVRADGEEG